MGLPETPRWYENNGFTAEAQAIMDKIEKEVEQETGPLPPVVHRAKEEDIKGRFGEIWIAPYRRRTIMLIVFNLFQTIGF